MTVRLPQNTSAVSDPLSAGRARLRTLANLRWIAVAGQLLAVMIVHFGLGYPLPLLPCLYVISSLVLLNVVTPAYRRGHRIGGRDALLFLAFDMVQLTLLLSITGGLANPFVLLILGPLTAAAGLLSRKQTALLTGLALGCLTILGWPIHVLPWAGAPPTLPTLYMIGIWVALAIASCFIAGYNWIVTDDTRRVSDALSATQLALAREQRRSALGALAAAAAHELGSPLGTIAVIAKELSREVPAGSSLSEDIALLQSQSNRCRDILTELARRPEPSSGPFDRMALPALIEAVAAPYQERGIVLSVMPQALDTSAPPVVRRSPELMHGLGNLLQNAMQFARGEVQARIDWSATTITIVIEDDGPGFPVGLINRLGEPYISGRANSDEHLGLGVFIALTLLERTGATLEFDNSPEGGARIACRWNRGQFERHGED
jgi:two-component system sensor histidine kinase RegB